MLKPQLIGRSCYDARLVNSDNYRNHKEIARTKRTTNQRSTHQTMKFTVYNVAKSLQFTEFTALPKKTLFFIQTMIQIVPVLRVSRRTPRQRIIRATYFTKGLYVLQVQIPLGFRQIYPVSTIMFPGSEFSRSSRISSRTNANCSRIY